MKFSDFGFQENPFSITPDPRYLFLSRGHEESLAHLIYGTGPNGGFVQLTGEVGTGKTMLVRSLLEQKLENVDIALILNPRLSRRDFMAAICDELGISYEGPPYQLKQLSDDLSRYLLKTHAQGRHTVVVIDEAQNLSPRVLEQIRLLTNLETSRHKLLRIILVGQPELQQLLARKDLRQVDQRITARYHLSPLSRQETSRYIRHRLTVAGVNDNLFFPSALRLVHILTGGVPRKINTLCERTLLAVFTSGSKRVRPRMVWRAWREIKGRRSGNSPLQWVGAGALLFTSAVAVWWMLKYLEQDSNDLQAEANTDGEIIQITPSPAQPEKAASLATLEKGGQLDGGLQTAKQSDEPDLPQWSDSLLSAPGGYSGLPGADVKRILNQKLFNLWDRSVGGDVADICRQALLVGLRCLSGVTNWEGLLRLDRPLICQLQSGETSSPVLVKGVLGDELLVDDANAEYRIGKDAFSERWQGDFVMLWRPPEGGALVGPGSSGEAVTWLRKRLSLADGEPVPGVVGLDHFENDLKLRLQRFQEANGLMADGIAGAWTMILLNNLSLPAETPTLQGGG
ncbi:MAG: AAA family ATPase [Gammaproteobacteria bacterium]|nr:AAA family ATPase [Gammaproteobacteria bacterium]